MGCEIFDGIFLVIEVSDILLKSSDRMFCDDNLSSFTLWLAVYSLIVVIEYYIPALGSYHQVYHDPDRAISI